MHCASFHGPVAADCGQSSATVSVIDPKTAAPPLADPVCLATHSAVGVTSSPYGLPRGIPQHDGRVVSLQAMVVTRESSGIFEEGCRLFRVRSSLSIGLAAEQ